MGRNAWLKNARKKKIVATHTRVTKKGDVQIVQQYEHDYPNKLKPINKEERVKKNEDIEQKKDKTPEEENLAKNKKPEDEATGKLKPAKDQNEIDKAKDEVACRLGV